MNKWKIVGLTLACFGLAQAGRAAAMPEAVVTFSPLAASPGPVHEGVYGVRLESGTTISDLVALNVTSVRLGAPRYNFKIHAVNQGAWWFFTNYPTRDLKEEVQQFVQAGMHPAVILGLLGWIPKDTSSSSFPTSQFPDQKHSIIAMGDGVRGDGTLLRANPDTANVAVDIDYTVDLVQYLRPAFAGRRPVFVFDDNPERWFIVARDIHPEPTSYDEYLARYLQAAEAVRRAAPDAYLIAPALHSLFGIEYSAKDLRGRWSGYRFGEDRKAHGGVPFLEWFVSRVREREEVLGVSLLDAIDAHHFAYRERWPSGDANDPKVRRAVLDSTRSLWDKSYSDNSWVQDKIYLVPRLQDIAARTKPSLDVVIGSFSVPAGNDLSSAIALVESLGVFLSHGVKMAFFNLSLNTGARASFRLLCDYDGQRSRFKGARLANSVGPGEELSVFSAYDRETRRLLVLVVNKSLEQARTLKIDPISLRPEIGRWSRASLYGFDEKSLPGGSEAYRINARPGAPLSVVAPPLSARLLVLDHTPR